MDTLFHSTFFQTVLGSIASGTLIAAIIGLIFFKRNKKIEHELEKIKLLFLSERQWKEKSVSELLGPVYMQLERTSRAFERWEGRNFYIEMKVIKEGNLQIRDLLLSTGHLIPPDLRDDAAKLIEHYDRWLEEFEKLRNSENPDLKTPFVFVGPQGFPFPSESDMRFRNAFKEMWLELYASSKS